MESIHRREDKEKICYFHHLSVFGAIFEVNSSIGKWWDLLGHFDENDKVDF